VKVLLNVFLLIFLIGSFTPVAMSQETSWEDLILKSRESLRKGKYSDAAYSGQEALKVAEKKFGPKHPNVSEALSNLATIYVSQGEYLKADQHCQRCIKIYEKIFGKDHIKVAEALVCLSFVYQAQGKYEEAEQLSLRIFETKKDGFWKDYPQAPYLGFYFENCNEPSIYYFRKQPGVECYRFTRISHSPGGGHSFVRIIKNKSSIKLYTGYRGRNAKNSNWRLASRDLKEKEWKTVTDAISNRAFWDLSYWDPIKGYDGGTAILEGVNKGRYHLVKRWSPHYKPSERGLNEFRDASRLFSTLLEIK
jgi:tetratricopeptide (TPR) repeat protein